MDGAREVVETLLRVGLLSTADVVTGRLNVSGSRSRSSCYRITRRVGPGYFVKQASDDSAGAVLLRREAAALRAIGRVPPSQRPLVPGVVLETDTLLVTELMTPTPQRSRRSRVVFSVTRARRLARQMARLHYVPAIEFGVQALLPHGFVADRIALSSLEDASAARLELVQVLQGLEGLRDRLDSASADWETSHPIHGDLKEANLITVAPERGCDIAFVDWEGAGLGDPAWDVGSIIADALSQWLWSIRPPTDVVSPASIAQSARIPLAWVLPAVRAFAFEYHCRSEPGGFDPARTMSFAAIRILQTASERAQASTRLTATDVAAVQVAVNILSRPEAAATRFMALQATNS